MMLKKFLITGDIDNSGQVHGVHIFEDNFTFCGMAIIDDGIESEETRKKLTCPRCIAWVDFCKTIKSTQIDRKFTKRRL